MNAVKDLRHSTIIRDFETWISSSADTIVIPDETVYKCFSKDQVIEGIPSLRKFKFYATSSVFSHLGTDYHVERGHIGSTLAEAECCIRTLLEAFPSTVLRSIIQFPPEFIGEMSSGKTFSFIIQHGVIK
jgi:hypothetical protein